MKRSQLPYRSIERTMVDTFRGYDHNLRIGEGEAWDMRNMTSDQYPVMSPRNERGKYRSVPGIGGIIAKEKLCYTDGSAFVIGDDRYEMGLSEGEKTLVSMGAFVIILPDRKYINTAQPEDRGDIENQTITLGEATFTMSNASGDVIEGVITSDTAPENPKNGDHWIDTSEEKHSLKRWASTSSQWVTIPTTYVRIDAVGIGKGFQEHDGVTISGVTVDSLTELNGTMVLWAVADDYIVVTGFLDKAQSQSAPILVSRRMPEMDFVTESGNRLWGCRYGMNAAGEFVNELYASALGDFRNWNSFLQISTDSYAVSLGTDGPFTGAVTHMGYPIFFRENFFHKVYGNIPANFQVQTTACRGVQQGSHRSLAIVNEVLYYKAGTAVCAYDGSLPTEISYCLGNVHYSNAVAGAHGNKYYISMMDLDGGWHLFVWDSARKLWHREDNFHALGFASHKNQLYGVDENGMVWSMLSGDGEERLSWLWDTGEIGLNMPDMKYINHLTIRMSLESGTEVRIFAKYNQSDEWQPLHALRSTELRSFDIPIKPRRCDYMQLRISGDGPAKIYSITKNIMQGGTRS